MATTVVFGKIEFVDESQNVIYTMEMNKDRIGLLFHSGFNTPPLCGVIVLPHESLDSKKP